jgi:outer membrane protein assembly factor BamB
VFILTAVPIGEEIAARVGFFGRLGRRVLGGVYPNQLLRFTVLALSRYDGRILWKRVAVEALPHEGTHQTGSWASSSAVADEEQVCAFFGSQGLYCYDFDGHLIWQKDFGDMRVSLGFGEGASPALHRDTIVVNWDHQGQSFIAALDKRTGEERWRAERDEQTSWATPLVVEHEDRTQVVTSGSTRVRAYDFETGHLVWENEGVTENAIPSPVASEGMVFVTSGYRGNQLWAIRLEDAYGDISGTDAIAWSLEEDTPYVPSPLLYDGILYLLKSNSGVISTFDAETGQRFYGPVRLPGIRNVYASPVGAGGRIYITGRDGTTLVIAKGSEFNVMATNSLDDGFDASPAVVGDAIYLRGQEFLYCIAADRQGL